MSPFEVGVAVRDITPPDEWIQAGRIWLWGYGVRSEVCDGVYQRISARALVVRDADGNAISLASVDLGALDPTMTQSIRERINASQGIAGEYICVNVTHTHGAPVVTTIPTWQPGVDRPDPAYVRFVEDAIVGVIDEAFANMRPATISFGRGATGIGYDRHFPPLGQPSCYDPTLDVIKIAGDQASVIAVAFFAACHPV